MVIFSVDGLGFAAVLCEKLKLGISIIIIFDSN